MPDIKVTLVQANQIWEDKQANVENYERLLSSVKRTDLIVLPEMFNTGFSMNAETLSEEFNCSESIDWIKKIAKLKDSAIYTSLIIKENNSFYNRGVFIEPDGKLSYYDKRKTFGLAGEDKVYSSGNQPVIVEYKGWKIQLQICYDLRFPEISLNTIEGGNPKYDILLYVANWPEKRATHWRQLLPARAIENQCYLVAVNRVGEDQLGLTYSGDSCVIDLLGNKLATLSQTESVITTTLSREFLVETRNKLRFLKDRIV